MEVTSAYLQLLMEGDQEAYRLLYKDFFAALCVFSRRIGVDKEEAEDIVQEVFCHIYRETLLPLHPDAFKSYLYTAVRNRCLNFIRDTRRRKNNELLYAESLDMTTFFDQIVESEFYRELNLLLEELPKQCRNIYERSLLGDTSEKIAVDLHLSVETVKTQRKNAKKILREKYQVLYKLLGIILSFF